MAIYSTELIKQQRSSAALELFVKYGAPAKPQNLNIYRHLATEILLEDKNKISINMQKDHIKMQQDQIKITDNG